MFLTFKSLNGFGKIMQSGEGLSAACVCRLELVARHHRKGNDARYLTVVSGFTVDSDNVGLSSTFFFSVKYSCGLSLCIFLSRPSIVWESREYPLFSDLIATNYSREISTDASLTFSYCEVCVRAQVSLYSFRPTAALLMQMQATQWPPACSFCPGTIRLCN